MHMIAVCQARSDPRGKAYYRKKLEEGKKMRREAMRCQTSPLSVRRIAGVTVAGNRDDEKHETP
jgi:hypothetical protein